MRHLALDFGTTNTVLATWDDVSDAASLVYLPDLSIAATNQPPLIPSLVYVHDDGRLTSGFGVQQMHLNAHNNHQLFRNFKRSLIEIAAPPPRFIAGRLWQDQEIGEHFIRQIFASLPESWRDIDQLVITAPVAAFQGYVTWLNGILDREINVVDESTAAALGYAITEPGALVLVFDFGGGTLDLSLVKLPDSRAQTGGALTRLLHGNANAYRATVVAKAGYALGGSDVDQWLAQWVLEQPGLSDGSDDYSALLTRCEQAKIALSSAESAVIMLDGQPVIITRYDLVRLLEANGFFAGLHRAIDRVLMTARQQGIFREDLHYVLMVGGMSLMPAVQDTLHDYFGAVAVRAHKPFTAVVEGALQVARGYGVEDYLAHGFGLRHLDPVSGMHHFEELIPMGTPYPLAKPVEVILGAAHDRQTQMELIIGEIDSDAVAMLEVRYHDGQAVFVARSDSALADVRLLNATWPTLLDLQPPGTPGSERIKAAFTVDDRRQLCVTVTDLQTHKTLLRNCVMTTLHQEKTIAEAAPVSIISRREPRLVAAHSQGTFWKVSPRRLATMLNVLPPDRISLPAAAAALRHPNFGVRYNAAVALSRRGDRDARLIMRDVLTDGDAPTRASVARHLAGFSWYAAEPLLRLALRDSDWRVREAAVYALCDFIEPAAYDLLAQVLEHEDDEVRLAAAIGLRDRQDPAAVPVLATVLAVHDPEIRIATLWALGANHTRPAVPVVQAVMLTDCEPQVVYEAAQSLVELDAEGVLPAFIAAIRNAQQPFRAEIIRGLFHAANYTVFDLSATPHTAGLIDALALALSDPATRYEAVWPLVWMRHPRADAVLRETFTQATEPDFKFHLVRIALNLMSEISDELLREALADPTLHPDIETLAATRARLLGYDATAARGMGLRNPALGR